jgi:hypothetical protein
MTVDPFPAAAPCKNVLLKEYAFRSSVITSVFDHGVCLTAATLGDKDQGHSLPIEIVSAIVLREAVRMAESKLAPRRVRRAVITVPAHFSERQRPPP